MLLIHGNQVISFEQVNSLKNAWEKNVFCNDLGHMGLQKLFLRCFLINFSIQNQYLGFYMIGDIGKIESKNHLGERLFFVRLQTLVLLV